MHSFTGEEYAHGMALAKQLRSLIELHEQARMLNSTCGKRITSNRAVFGTDGYFLKCEQKAKKIALDNKQKTSLDRFLGQRADFIPILLQVLVALCNSKAITACGALKDVIPLLTQGETRAAKTASDALNKQRMLIGGQTEKNKEKATKKLEKLAADEKTLRSCLEYVESRL